MMPTSGRTAAVLLVALLAAGNVVAQDRPAAQLERMSWDSSCSAIRDHLATALKANAEIDAATRATIRSKLDEADPEADRSACLEPLKDAYDRLVAAYERTAPSANILGGATAAPSDPAAVDPETIEGERTGERIGEGVDVGDTD